jgi:rhamnogalacturonan endolyase
VYACFVKPIRAYEASTGGPFQRDIRLNLIKDDFQDVTFYMNHGEFPWDPIRTGFHGPYGFTFADDLPDPNQFNYSFIEKFELSGYLGDSERGIVTGKGLGTSTDFPMVIHWYNDDCQQWTYATSDRSFQSPMLSPGIYTQALYHYELLAGTTTVTVKVGATATATVSATNPIITEGRSRIFQIGDYDGRATGFLNADKQPRMHVSDERMDDWNTPTYVVGQSSMDEFPMAIFEDINNNRKIQFSLTSAITTAAAIRVGTTQSFYFGKPTIKVNSYDCGTFDDPNASSGRGITKVLPLSPFEVDRIDRTQQGKSHGDMTVYYCKIPAGNLVSGTNTVTLGVTSKKSGDSWLSPNYVRADPTGPHCHDRSDLLMHLSWGRSLILWSFIIK